jgi:hypothetical protein
LKGGIQRRLWPRNDALVRPGNLGRKSTMKRKILGGALACMTLFAGTTGAMADTLGVYPIWTHYILQRGPWVRGQE